MAPNPASAKLSIAAVCVRTRENADVFDFEITDEDMAALADLNERYSSLGSLPYV